jgi:hypothetical protein
MSRVNPPNSTGWTLFRATSRLTGAVLHRHLVDIVALADRSLAETAVAPSRKR